MLDSAVAHRQGGFSLTELMVASAVGLIVLTGVLATFVNSLSSSSQHLKTARLNQDLSALMDIIVRDIRRAGYAALRPGVDNDNDDDVDSADLQFNPFLNSDYVDLTTGQKSGESANSCIVYAYNIDEDSRPRIGCGPSCTPPNDYYDNGANEIFGFRLNNAAVQMRYAGTPPATCNSGNWEAITDPDTQISALQFAITTTTVNATAGKAQNDPCVTGDTCQYTRLVGISLSGQLAEDQTVFQTISEQVRIRNDKYVASVP